VSQETDTAGAERVVEPGRSGHRVVLLLYAVVVAVAGFTGLVLGYIGPRDLDPQLFGFIPMPPTPLGMAAYGAITLAVVLGVVIALVVFVSERYVE